MICLHPESACVKVDAWFTWCSRCGSLCSMGTWRPPSIGTPHEPDDPTWPYEWVKPEDMKP